MPGEERAIYLAMIAIAILPLAAAIGRGAAIGGGATLCALLAAAGAIGLWRGSRRRTDVPAARAQPPRR